MKTYLPIRYSFCFAMLSGCLFLSGCFGGTKPDVPTLVPFKGTLVINGKPAPNVAIAVFPLGDQQDAVAVTDDAGHFEMKYRGTTPGVQPGSYQFNFGGSGADSDTKNPIPKKFQEAGGGMTVEVPAEGLTDYSLELKGV